MEAVLLPCTEAMLFLQGILGYQAVLAEAARGNGEACKGAELHKVVRKRDSEDEQVSAFSNCSFCNT